MKGGTTTATTTPDDDLDPALRADGAGTTSDDGAPLAVGDDPRGEDPPPELPRQEHEDGGRRYRDQEYDQLRDRLGRAEGMIEARRQREIEEAARAGNAAPTDPVERQYFDLFQKWLGPQLQQAGQQIERVMTGMADKNDRLEFMLELSRDGYTSAEQEEVAVQVERIQREKLAQGRYLTRAEALDIHEGQRVRKQRRTGGASRRSEGNVGNGTRSPQAASQNAETQNLRERGKTGAMVPNNAPAGRRSNASEKRDEDLSLEELETKYADHWV